MGLERGIEETPELYGELILDHYRNPRNRGRIPAAPIHGDGDNPVCGDRIEVWATVDAASRFEDLKFEGTGCAISQASASVLFEHLKGQPMSRVRGLNASSVFDLVGFRIAASRVKCATLGLVALQGAVRKVQAPSD